jgi:GGDEF domain-containing protein
VREIDTLARIGGEEFALLLPQTTPDDAERLVERLRAGGAELRNRRQRRYRALDVTILASAFVAIVVVLVKLIAFAAQVAALVRSGLGARGVTALVARRRIALGTTVAFGALFTLAAVGIELEHDRVDVAQVVEHAHRHVR